MPTPEEITKHREPAVGQTPWVTAPKPAAAALADGTRTVMKCNGRKEPVIREIYERMFRASGLLP
jgi:hypothetical protein